MMLYHGSRFELPSLAGSYCLSKGAYLTPFIWAARLFAVEWSSKDVLDINPNIPGQVLRFRRKAPLSYPIYVYKTVVDSSLIVKAPTNMGGDFPYNYRTVHNVLVSREETHDDWKEFLPFTEDEDNWLR